MYFSKPNLLLNLLTFSRINTVMSKSSDDSAEKFNNQLPMIWKDNACNHTIRVFVTTNRTASATIVQQTNVMAVVVVAGKILTMQPRSWHLLQTVISSMGIPKTVKYKQWLPLMMAKSLWNFLVVRGWISKSLTAIEIPDDAKAANFVKSIKAKGSDYWSRWAFISWSHQTWQR